MRIVVALAYLLVSALSAPADAPHAHVYLVIVDGLDARLANAAHMPRLFKAVAHEPEPRDAADGRLRGGARHHGERVLEPHARRAAGDARGRGADRGGDALHGGRDDDAVARDAGCGREAEARPFVRRRARAVRARRALVPEPAAARAPGGGERLQPRWRDDRGSPRARGRGRARPRGNEPLRRRWHRPRTRTRERRV